MILGPKNHSFTCNAVMRPSTRSARAPRVLRPLAVVFALALIGLLFAVPVLSAQQDNGALPELPLPAELREGRSQDWIAEFTARTRTVLEREHIPASTAALVFSELSSADLPERVEEAVRRVEPLLRDTEIGLRRGLPRREAQLRVRSRIESARPDRPPAPATERVRPPNSAGERAVERREQAQRQRDKAGRGAWPAGKVPF